MDSCKNKSRFCDSVSFLCRSAACAECHTNVGEEWDIPPMLRPGLPSQEKVLTPIDLEETDAYTAYTLFF